MINDSNDIKVSKTDDLKTDNQIHESFFIKSKTLPKLDYLNENLTPSSLTLRDLGKLILLRYGSLKEFGRLIGISRSRVSQILKGLYVPKKPKTIRKFAQELGIDEVILTTVFLRESKEVLNKKHGD